VLVFSGREDYLFILGDLISQIIVNGGERIIKDLKVISSQDFDKFLNVIKVSVSVICKPLFMIAIIPARSNTVLYFNTVFGFLVLEA
jgi:hypothetical protein